MKSNKRQLTFLMIILNIIIITFIFPLSSCQNIKDQTYLRGFLLDREQMSEKDHVDWIKDYSSHNIAAYENKEGTKTLYIYSGLIENTKNYTVSEENEYLADGTYVTKKFPKSFNKDSGIYIISNSREQVGEQKNYMNIFPNDQDKSYEAECADYVNVFNQKNTGLQYKNVFGDKSDLYFYPTVYGVNSEIIIPDKDSVRSYTFKIKVPEIMPDTASPDYMLLKKRNSDNVLSMIYTPLLVDKKGKWSFNNKVKFIEKDYENGMYVVEFIPDEEFLSSNDTKYPVIMNQSFYLAHENGDADTSAYSDAGDEAKHYLSTYMLLGDKTFKGEGHSFIRYESLNDLNINPEDIISAKYCFRNLLDLSEKATIGLYAVTSNWCSINTTWSSKPEYDENIVTQIEVYKKGDYSLNITPLIKTMIQSKENENAKYSIRNSFFIKIETSDIDVLLASGDSGLYTPCLELIFE